MFRNYILRIYGKNNRVLRVFRIENRSNNEANKEAMSFIENHLPNAEDWTLTTVVERDEAFKLLKQPRLRMYKNEWLINDIAEKFDTTVEVVTNLKKYNEL